MQALIGLVVCGGLSSRMGRDKSTIEWHGVAQRYFLYELLEPFCKKVFISCNDVQAHEIEPGYSYIVDAEKYRNVGPMAALLSAADKYPGESFMIVGCDYPFIKRENILQLINNRNEDDSAACFFNKATGFYEPLLAIYENRIIDQVFESFYQQQYSLQNILLDSPVRKIDPMDMNTIRSVNTEKEYLIVMEHLNGN